MKNLWYVSVASASTAAAPRRMHGHALLTPHSTVAAPALLAGAALALACSGSVASGSAGAGSSGPSPGARDREAGRARREPGRRALQGRRRPAPAATADGDAGGGAAARRAAQALRDPAGGRRAAARRWIRRRWGTSPPAPTRACFYIDVLPGTTSDVTFTATEAAKEAGVAPSARYRRVRTEGAVVVRRRQRPLRGAGRQVQPRRRRRLERGGEGPQARPRRPLRVVGDLAPDAGTRRAASAIASSGSSRTSPSTSRWR